MKKTTLKMTVFLLLTMFTFQVQGQAWNGTLGTYKIKVQGENLYFTQSSTTDNLTYEPEVAGSDTQLFIFDNHPDGDFFSITSKIPGKGVLETLTSEPGSTTNPAVGCKGNSASVGSGQQDKWNPTRGFGTQIYLESDKTGTAWASQRAKKRFQTYAQGGLAKLNGGTAVKFDFVFVEALSSKEFDVNSIFISNPVKNELTVQGLISKVKEVGIYDLLGKEIRSNKVNETSSFKMDVSALSSGLYIIKLKGENGSYSKKIVKE